MHALRCILAAIFAILIANPACCCAGRKVVKMETRHSCCGGAKKEKKESACNCEVNAPRIAGDHSIVVDAPAFLSPQPVSSVPVIREIPVAVVAPVSAVPVDPGPPRRRLTLFQRFMI